MEDKEFDARVGNLRYQFIALWKRQGQRNESYEVRIAVLQIQKQKLEDKVQKLEDKLDKLTRSICGGVDEASE